MSSKLVDRIWDHYPEGGGELLTALALAEHADPDGSNCFPNPLTVSVMTRQSKRTVQYHIARMLEIGWLLVVDRGGGRGKLTTYRIPIERIPKCALGTMQKLHRLEPQVPEDIEEKLPVAAAGKHTSSAVAKARGKRAESLQVVRKNRAKTASGSTGTSTSTSTSLSPNSESQTPTPPPALSNALRSRAAAKGYTDRLDERYEVYVNKVKKLGKVYADWDAGFLIALHEDWGDFNASAPANGKPWFIDSWRAILKKGDELGLTPEPDEPTANYRLRVLKAAGVTPEQVRKAERDYG